MNFGYEYFFLLEKDQPVSPAGSSSSGGSVLFALCKSSSFPTNCTAQSTNTLGSGQKLSSQHARLSRLTFIVNHTLLPEVLCALDHAPVGYLHVKWMHSHCHLYERFIIQKQQVPYHQQCRQISFLLQRLVVTGLFSFNPSYKHLVMWDLMKFLHYALTNFAVSSFAFIVASVGKVLFFHDLSALLCRVIVLNISIRDPYPCKW